MGPDDASGIYEEEGGAVRPGRVFVGPACLSGPGVEMDLERARAERDQAREVLGLQGGLQGVLLDICEGSALFVLLAQDEFVEVAQEEFVEGNLGLVSRLLGED